jgi:hypothetical protein
MKKVKSFNVQIWVGLKEGYDGIENPIDLVYNICNKYVNENIYCVSVTETKFFYYEGYENGAVIGLINYARFPSSKRKILKHHEKDISYRNNNRSTGWVHKRKCQTTAASY